MKPATKKTIIIIVAVAVVAAIVYFVFIRKGKTAKQIVNRMPLDEVTKQALLDRVGYIEASWDKAAIEANAQAKGRTYQQQLVEEAAYSLYQGNTITYEQFAAIIAQI